MSFRRSGMARVGGLLKTTIQDMGLQDKILQQQALTKWAEVVGRQIAASTTAESIREGVLFVCCKSSMWSSELSLHKQDILSRLNTAVGKPVVKDIRFTARGFRKAKDEAAESGIRQAEEAEHDPEEVRAAEEAASVCSSDDLAERVKQAVMASKKRKTG